MNIHFNFCIFLQLLKRKMSWLLHEKTGNWIVVLRRVRKIAKKPLLTSSHLTVCLSVCLSVRPSVRPSPCNNSEPNGLIFIKFDISVFFENLSRTFEFHSNRGRLTGNLHEHLCTFMIVSRSFLLWLRTVSGKNCTEVKTHILYSETFYRTSCRLQDNVEK